MSNIMKKILFTNILFLFASFSSLPAANLFIEAESFTKKGGWVVDQQFMDLMGSSYLMAHGMGEPVEDAQTEVTSVTVRPSASIVWARLARCTEI